MNADNTTAQMTTSKAATLCGLRRPCLPARSSRCVCGHSSPRWLPRPW